MNVSFGAGQTPVVETPAQPQAPAAAPASELPAVRLPSGVPAKSGLLLGDYVPDFSDIMLPRVNLVQGIGKLKDTFIPGSVILGQQTPLYVPADVDVSTGNVRRAATPPVGITVLGFRPTRFVEKVEGGARGLIVNSEDEVRRNGGTLDYQEWKLKKASGMKRFEALADAVVLIERPEQIKDDGTVFVFDCEGKKYAFAMFALKGTLYTAAAKKVFFTHRSIGCLREGGYPSFHYYLTTKLENWPGGNSSWIPICVSGTKSSPAFLDFVAGLIGGTPAPAAPAA
jgi:hypothetical protein